MIPVQKNVFMNVALLKQLPNSMSVIKLRNSIKVDMVVWVDILAQESFVMKTPNKTIFDSTKVKSIFSHADYQRHIWKLHSGSVHFDEDIQYGFNVSIFSLIYFSFN